MNILPMPQTWSVQVGSTYLRLTLTQLKALHSKLTHVIETTIGGPHDAIEIVCKKFNIGSVELFSDKRSNYLAMARWCTFYLLKKNGMKNADIARLFKLDDSTVGYGLRKLQLPKYKQEITKLETEAKTKANS